MVSLIRYPFLAVSITLRAVFFPLETLLGQISRALSGLTPPRIDESGALASTSKSDGTTSKAGDRPHVRIVEIHRYCPPGVSQIINRGGGNFIGLINETTALKYPCISTDRETIKVEAQLLEGLGHHSRIIGFHGLTEHGLILQHAVNGDIYDYITSEASVPLDRKLCWCKQAAEAVSYIHTKHVIHCDINLRNVLLDKNNDLLLADFQGVLKSTDGETLLDGLSRECSKSFMPRHYPENACVKTDLFALGSAIYFIMTGHEVFPELESWKDDEDDEILSLFEKGLFPTDEHVCYQYQSANDSVSEISLIQVSLGE